MKLNTYTNLLLAHIGGCDNEPFHFEILYYYAS